MNNSNAMTVYIVRIGPTIELAVKATSQLEALNKVYTSSKANEIRSEFQVTISPSRLQVIE